MALVGIRLDSVFDYHSVLDDACIVLIDEETGAGKVTGIKEGETPITFKLGTLSSRMMVHLRDSATSFVPDPNDPSNVTAKFLPNHSSYETVRYGLKGWKDFHDADGNDMPFVTVSRSLGGSVVDCVSDKTMDAMPLDLIRELADKIVNGNELTAEAAKNSEE